MWGDYNFGSTGSNNTATGSQALVGNSNGSNNTASGASALHGNVSGNYNTATGQGSLYSNDGSNNTADGQNALKSNTTGSNNVAVGSNAGKNLTTGNNNIDVSNPGVAGEANTIRIGKQGTQTATFIAGVYNANEGGTIKPVYVNSNGRLGTQAPASSQRFKTNVKPMGSASEAILGLKPVTFHYKSDSESTPHFGLIAEQVEKVNPDLVVRDEHGEIYTVRYEAVNAMLLNEFLKEHQQFEEQKAGLAEMKSVVSKQEELIAKQQKQIETLTATVRKVSERIELSAPAVQIAVNDE